MLRIDNESDNNYYASRNLQVHDGDTWSPVESSVYSINTHTHPQRTLTLDGLAKDCGVCVCAHPCIYMHAHGGQILTSVISFSSPDVWRQSILFVYLSVYLSIYF